MAELADRPFPPGTYPAVVVGSGPGAIQTSYSLSRLGVEHAVISSDPVPGGMFRRFPFFQRLLSWTKPYAPVERESRAYEWYDWNSLLADEPEHRSIVPTLIDGTSSFPSRPEMELGIATFAQRTGVRVRYDCRWESTRREDDGGFVLITTDGEYRCRIAIFAVGVAEPWKPPTPGFENVPHYVDTREPEYYSGKRLFIVGKQNSAFELATGLLAHARRIVLASPRPAQLSINLHSLAGIRARYVQPLEDSAIGGGVFALNGSIERVERMGDAQRVHLRTAEGTTTEVEADEVIAATGFTAPLRDLPAMGVATFGQSRLPAQTPFWESATVPGIYFAGTIGQGAAGLKKYGIPANSGAVHGARYNARVLTRHVAERHFGVALPRPQIEPRDVASYFLQEATTAPELLNQRSYLARVVAFDPAHGIRDEGIVPLAHFVDSSGPDAVAVAVETDDTGDIHPALYLRRAGRVEERLLSSDPLLDFRTSVNRAAVDDLLRPLIGSAGKA